MSRRVEMDMEEDIDDIEISATPPATHTTVQQQTKPNQQPPPPVILSPSKLSASVRFADDEPVASKYSPSKGGADLPMVDSDGDDDDDNAAKKRSGGEEILAGNNNNNKDERPTSSSSQRSMTPKKKMSRSMSMKKSMRAMRRMSTMHAVKRSVPVGFVLTNLRNRIESNSITLELLLFIPFVVLFIFFFVGGRNIEASFYTSKCIRDNVIEGEYPSTTSNVAAFQQQLAANASTPAAIINIPVDHSWWDTGNAGDWYQWLQDGFIPNTFDCNNPDVSRRNLAIYGRNMHIGAIRVRTQRVKMDSCTLNSERVYNGTVFAPPCAAAYSTANEQTSDFCNLPYVSGDSDINRATLARDGLYHTGGFVMDIPTNTSCNGATAIAQFLASANCSFLDFATRFVTVEYFMFIPSTSAFLSVRVFMEVSPSGAWVPQLKLDHFLIHSNHDAGEISIAILFLSYVMLYIGIFMYQSLQAWKAGMLMSFLTDVWTLIEVANLVTFLVVFGMRFMWWGKSIEYNIRLPLPAHVYPDQLNHLRAYYAAHLTANSVNTIFTFLKILKFFRLNPYLNVVTKTLSICKQNIVGILVLFVLILLTFACAATALYGTNLEQFRSVVISFSTLLRMLLGEFSYDEMHQVNAVLTGLFFWSFIILGMFLMLNFIVAVISEAFAKISGTAHNVPLDKTLIRYFKEVRAFMQWDNFVNFYKATSSGYSQSYLIGKCVEQIEQKSGVKRVKQNSDSMVESPASRKRHEQQKTKDDGVELEYDKETLMFRDDWSHWVEQDVRDKLGEPMIDYLWTAIVHDFDDERKSEDYASQVQLREAVEDQLRKALKNELTLIDQVDEVLCALESHVSRLTSDFISGDE